MKASIKYGVSAIALLAAISLAHAQINERQGGGASGSEHSMAGRGGEPRSAQGERGAQSEGASRAERGQNGASMHQGKSAEQGDHSQRGQSTTQHEQGGAQKGRTAEERSEGSAHHEQSVERNRAEGQAAQEREGGRAGQAERNAGQGQGERSARTERENRGIQGEETRGRETELGGARGRETTGRAAGERFASISREQKTRIHGILFSDNAIHRYHETDVHVPIRVGARIPDAIEFYTPPAQVVQIDPVFRDYKIVVLDDVILVVDPYTREIVDVIRV
jgi:hypothetical protein